MYTPDLMHIERSVIPRMKGIYSPQTYSNLTAVCFLKGRIGRVFSSDDEWRKCVPSSEREIRFLIFLYTYFSRILEL